MISNSLVIGLTGGIASGKTTVANYLSEQGAYLIDTDVISREVVSPKSLTSLAIRNLLGSGYLLEDGNLNRDKIKQCIFNDANIMMQYEAIIMPAIREATIDALQEVPINACYTLLIVPLLFEKELDKQCDYSISVDVPVDEQIRRGIARKPDDETVIRQVIKSQLPRGVRNACADFIVDNNVSIEKLHAQLDILHQQLLNL